jgi:hypothetical protein
MKEDNNNIKMLIAAILKLSLKLSKCNTSANAAPKAPKTSAKAAKAANAPKTSAKAAKAPRVSAKAAPRVSAKAASKTVMRKIVGGGSAEFFE